MDFGGRVQLCANIERENWDQVALLLRHNNYSSSSVGQFVAACEENDVIHVDGEILSHCSSEQKDRLLGIAVHLCQKNVDRWNEVTIVLQNCNYSCSSIEQFVTACEEYDVIHVDREILSHCSSEQKDRLLGIAVKKERWEDVDNLLQDTNYSSSSVEHCVAACEQYGVIYVDREILSHCSSEQRDRLLKPAVKNEKWEGVDILLQDKKYSSSSVEQFVAACEEYEVIYVDGEILSHCSSEQRDRLLKPAVKNERWEGVDILLHDKKYSSSSVEQFVAACEEYEVIYVDGEILSHCSSQQRDRLLKPAVKNERWEGVDILLQDNKYSCSSVETFVAACEQYEVIYVDGEILSHCSSEQKDRLLKPAVKNERWEEVDSLLQDNKYSSSSMEKFVAACEQYEVIHVDGEILSHCSSEQRDRLLKPAVKNERWEEVDNLLQDNNYNSSSVDTFVTACGQYEVIHIDRDILSHCSSEQNNSLLKIAVHLCTGDRDRWSEVKILLQHSNYSSSSVEQFVAACEHEYDVIHVDGEILSHCNSEQRDRLLKKNFNCLDWCFGEYPDRSKMVAWKDVKILLQASNYSRSSVEQFVAGCEQCGVINVDDEILSHCTSQQKDRLLKEAVALCKENEDGWNYAKILLQDNNYSSSSVEQFVTACEQYNVIHVDHEILSHCSSEQKDRLLKPAVKNERWEGVDILLQDNKYSSSSMDTFVAACDEYEVIHVNSEILSHCSSEQKNRLLNAAVRQYSRSPDWLNDVNDMNILLQDSNYSSISVEQFVAACEKYRVIHVDDEILSNCNTEQRDRLLELAISSNHCEVVSRLFKAGVGHEQRVWAFVEVCETADPLEFQRYISPDCDGQLFNQIVNNVQNGFTVLFSAMLNEHCPQRMVAECIRLGFSTHQPPPVLPTTTGIAKTVTKAWMTEWNIAVFSGIITSPFLLAVLREMPVVAHMLYESGSSSYPELLHLYTVLLDLSDPHTEDGRKFLVGEYLTEWERRSSVGLYPERYNTFMNTLTTFLPYLREMASTPRSLESSCRLVISHCLTGGEGRERAVQELPLPEGLKDYLLFSDLTDPDYQPRMYGTMSAALLQQE